MVLRTTWAPDNEELASNTGVGKVLVAVNSTWVGCKRRGSGTYLVNKMACINTPATPAYFQIPEGVVNPKKVSFCFIC